MDESAICLGVVMAAVVEMFMKIINYFVRVNVRPIFKVYSLVFTCVYFGQIVFPGFLNRVSKQFNIELSIFCLKLPFC